MQKLYQWFQQRASLFHTEEPKPGCNHTVRTEVTVETERTTVLFGSIPPNASQCCPLCGQKLTAAKFTASEMKETKDSSAKQSAARQLPEA